MKTREGSWCVECDWITIKIPLGEVGRSAYWCRLEQRRLDGPVVWRRACERFLRPRLG